MTLESQKEEFSRAYVQAVVACAGLSWGKPSVDDDSIDMTVSARGSGRLKLDLQLKCTATPSFSFPLKVKNYNDLAEANTMVPRLLVVLFVPEAVSDWLAESTEQLAMRRCAYWLNLQGRASTVNSSTVTVELDPSQVFSVAQLTAIFKRVSTGARP